MQKVKSKKNLIFGVVIAVLCFPALNLRAQDTDALGTYTPYSLYGLGDIAKQGTATNKSMGGIGIGVRDNRFINYMNPAAITERDTLSFMLDFGLSSSNYYSTSRNGVDNDKVTTAYNGFNIQNFVLTAPIYKKSAMVVGIAPFSYIGYKFESTENDPLLVSKYGDIKYQKYGEGTINQLFVGGAMNFFKNFSIGVQYFYYFGALNRYSNILFNSSASFRSPETGWDYSMKGHTLKVGLQYFKRFGERNQYVATVGASYRMATTMKGDYTRFAYAVGETTDTIAYESLDNARIKIPHEYAFGVSFRNTDKWLVGVDYTMNRWEKDAFSETPGVEMDPQVSYSVNLGVEYIPNRYDIRYYMKRVTYRAGAYYDKTYMRLGSHDIKAYGVTFGMSLPIYRYYNAVNFAVELGRRGTLKNHLVRENYIQFHIGISLHDIWFVKYRYE